MCTFLFHNASVRPRTLGGFVKESMRAGEREENGGMGKGEGERGEEEGSVFT
jgi:hypothetical protein